MARTIRRAALGVVAALLLLYLAAAFVVWRFPDRLIDFPERETPQTPGAVGLSYVDIWLEVGTSHALVHGWWIPKHEGAPVVLLLHGTGRTIRGLVHVASALHDAGAAVLMIDYRGLGRSDRGPLTEATMIEDAKAAWQHLLWFQPEPARQLVYGHSLGAAIALELAAGNPAVAGVIIEGAPTSLRELLGSWRIAWLFPVEWLLGERFDVAAKLPRVRAPLLVIHGKTDRIVPPAMGATLHGRANEPKWLLLVDRAGHSDASLVAAREYQSAVRKLLPPGKALAHGDGDLGGVRRPADRTLALDELRAREDPRLGQAWTDDLEADGEPRSAQPGRHAHRRERGEGHEECLRDPVDVALELAPGDLGRIVLFDGER
jgi:pimeloyl-ACP methyl ester carboxylesterase